MSQTERRHYLLRELLKEKKEYADMEIPAEASDQRRLLRSLMNVRWAAPISEEFQRIQDAYLQEEKEKKGVVTLDMLEECQDGLYLWQGDITRLQVSAIVNAANSGMTGCYQPCHACIDNCIHTYAGMELRNYCQSMMDAQGHEEPTGQAKITPGFNLPCDYVIHTVGPVVRGTLTERHEELLASCYRSCLEMAENNSIKSIAFCCISTGVFLFPNRRAAEIAVETVKRYKQETGSRIKVVFNVFKDLDKEIYQELLG